MSSMQPKRPHESGPTCLCRRLRAPRTLVVVLAGPSVAFPMPPPAACALSSGDVTKTDMPEFTLLDTVARKSALTCRLGGTVNEKSVDVVLRLLTETSPTVATQKKLIP